MSIFSPSSSVEKIDIAASRRPWIAAEQKLAHELGQMDRAKGGKPYQSQSGTSKKDIPPTYAELGVSKKRAARALRKSKDPLAREQLVNAIETKIDAQVDYVVRRDAVVISASDRGKRGGRGKKQITELKSALPDAAAATSSPGAGRRLQAFRAAAPQNSEKFRISQNSEKFRPRLGRLENSKIPRPKPQALPSGSRSTSLITRPGLPGWLAKSIVIMR
jgi:hypothetical protein